MPDNELELYRYDISAHVIEPTEKDYEELDNIVKGFFLASEAPFVDGKPRMMFINAWIAHEGRNRNGDAFIGEELKARVNEGLFQPPFAGMIDFDHDFTPRGFWYKASYAFDKAANKWGILATGAVWAWRFKDIASFMVQEMQNKGHITVSMSAIAEMIEPTFSFTGAKGEKTIIRHNPVFFTSAVLSVPPGDPDAIGTATVSENTSESTTISRADDDLESIITNNEEVIMTDKELETLQATNAQLEKDVSDLKIKLAEAEVNLRTVSDIKTSLETEYGAIKADLEGYKNREAAESEKNKAAQDKAKFDARLAEVPAIVKENLDKHANKELVLARWREVPDADWDVIKQGFALAYTAPTYLIRSKEEGVLPVTNDDKNEKDLKNFLRSE